MANQCYFVRNSQPAAAPVGVDYCIDYLNGDDRRDGTTPAKAWKRHPFDVNRTFNALAHTPTAGKKYALRGGVRYPNPLVGTAAGSAGNLITTVGDTTWGTGRALIDVGLECTIRNATAGDGTAYGLSNWADLKIIEHPSITSGARVWFSDNVNGTMFMGRYPAHPEPLYPDWIEYSSATTVSVDTTSLNYTAFPAKPLNPARSNEGVIASAELATRLAGQENWARVGYSGAATAIIPCLVTAIAGNNITLATNTAGSSGGPINTSASPAYVFYDRKSVTAPGYFAPVAAGVAVAYLRPGVTKVYLMRAASAVDYGGLNYLSLEGVTVANCLQSNFITNPGTGCQVKRSFIRDGYMERTINRWSCISAGTDMLIEDCATDRTIQYGFTSYNGVSGLIGRRISIGRCGGTTLPTSGGSSNILWEDIITWGCNGVHANGLSVYDNDSGNLGPGVYNNNNNITHRRVVSRTNRPATVQWKGSDNLPVNQALTFEECVFIGTQTGNELPASGFRHNDDESMRGVTFTRCVAVGGVYGIQMYWHCLDIACLDNLVTSFSSPDIPGGGATDNATLQPWTGLASNEVRTQATLLSQISISPYYATAPRKDGGNIIINLSSLPQNDLPD